MDTSDTYYKMCSKAFPKDAKMGIAFKTQDQLQEMIKFHIPFIIKFDYLGDAFDKILRQLGKSTTTWEQLWLAFVMKEKYNKIWSGEEWNEDK